MPDCLFCSIVAGDIPAERVYADERVLAFRDVHPQAPVHVLLVPRSHQRTVVELAAAEPETMVALIEAAGRVAASEGVAESGYRVVSNVGPDAHQSVDHVHLHLLGGRNLTWPPG